MKVGYVILAALWFAACGAPKPSVSVADSQERDTAYLQYEAMIRDFLVGKRMASLAEVMAPDPVPGEPSVLLVYHGMDCGSCMETGFGLLKRLRREGVPCAVVAVDANISEAQRQYEFFDYIYTDRRDRLRRELKYVNTPILLLLDDSLRIADIYKPAVGTDSAAERFGMAVARMRSR